MRYPSGRYQEGFYVKTVSSADTPSGTFCLINTECDDLNSLLRHVGAFETAYGYRPRSSRVGLSTYRWTWERLNSDGTRQSDAVWATKID